MSVEHYLQFPLCALAFGGNEKERLECIISFGFVDAGFALFKKLDRRLRKMKPDELAQCSGVPADYRKADFNHVAAMFGAQAIGISVGSVRFSLECWEELSQFRDQFQMQHGRDVEVRIRKALVFEARDNTGVGYREFTVFCAALSCIGAKKYPVRITRRTIQCRMLGYKSPAVMGAEIAKRTDGAKTLTSRQIGYTLDRLHERQFFARARANERQTFYSIRLKQDQLEAALVEGKTYARDFHERRRKRDAELIAKIKRRKDAIKADNAIEVNTLGENGSNEVHATFAAASAAASTGLSTLIKTPLIETLSIKTLSTETQGNNATALELDETEEKSPALEATTLEAVQSFAASLHKLATPELAAQWFNEYGTEPKWKGQNWRKPFSKWLITVIEEAKKQLSLRENGKAGNPPKTEQANLTNPAKSPTSGT